MSGLLQGHSRLWGLLWGLSLKWWDTIGLQSGARIAACRPLIKSSFIARRAEGMRGLTIALRHAESSLPRSSP